MIQINFDPPRKMLTPWQAMPIRLNRRNTAPLVDAANAPVNAAIQPPQFEFEWPGRQQHRTTNTLPGARRRQLSQGVRIRAQDRAEREMPNATSESRTLLDFSLVILNR